MWPFIEDLCRFDFEVSPEDEYMVGNILRGYEAESQTSSVLGLSDGSS
jgi:hypothetical protein